MLALEEESERQKRDNLPDVNYNGRNKRRNK